MLLCTACGEPVEGAVAVRSASGESLRFEPVQCYDGDDYGYWGVHLRDDDGRSMDIFERDGVPFAQVYAPGRAAFEVPLSGCEDFSGRLKRKTVNGSAHVRGEFRFACFEEDGRELIGDVTFEDCGYLDDDSDDDD